MVRLLLLLLLLPPLLLLLTTPAVLVRVLTLQALALREFALGLEGLERFVAAAPGARCVFALLALESEPVDPRL